MSQYEILCERILKLLQLMCENVNTSFQTFFRRQTEENVPIVSNLNVILEVSNFLCVFLEDELLTIDRKSIIIM